MVLSKSDLMVFTRGVVVWKSYSFGKGGSKDSETRFLSLKIMKFIRGVYHSWKSQFMPHLAKTIAPWSE